MLTRQRQQMLLDLLARQGQVIAKDFSQELGVSEDTIRRDMRELASRGMLQRVHGGALPASPAVADFAGRQRLAPEAKVAIGRAAALSIKRGQVVILDGGTTALQMARHLSPMLRATIVTHSPTVALEAAAHPHLEVRMLGGRLVRHSMVNVGAQVIEAAARIRADLYFLGVTGVHPDAGLSTGDAEEADVKRALHRQAAETVVLASREKLLATSAFLVAPLAEASLVVVPDDTPARILRKLRGAGLTVRTANAAAPATMERSPRARRRGARTGQRHS
jgi:DeoR/GlpR family transcriptional regulator of sugar metabolism